MINQILVNGEWVDGELSINGERYRVKIPVGQTFGYQEQIYSIEAETVLIDVTSIIVKINDVVADLFAGMYYANVGDTLNIVGNLTIGGVIQDAITYPITLKMPLIRHANGIPTNDEVYINVTLVSGVLTINGSIPRSGDWKISTTRNNTALKVIGAPFQLVADDITIIA